MKEKMHREHETGVKENSYWLNKLKEIDEQTISIQELNEYDAIIDSFDTETLKAAAKKYFGSENYIRVMLKPEK